MVKVQWPLHSSACWALRVPLFHLPVAQLNLVDGNLTVTVREGEWNVPKETLPFFPF